MIQGSSGLRAMGAVVAALVLLAPAAAQAKWLRAESPHFIVYSDGGEGGLRGYAQTLEDFDRLLRRMHAETPSMDDAPKLEVFMVDGPHGLREVFPQMRSGTAGVYTGSENGVFAVAFKPSEQQGDHVLKHEYYHHFMLQYYPGNYPPWMVEGLAEFFSSATPVPHKVLVGGPQPGHLAVLAGGFWIPLDELLVKSAFETRENRLSLYYSQSWLLASYMMTDPGRHKQLTVYVDAVRAGKDPVSSWSEATGEAPEATQKKLRSYLSNLMAIGLPVEPGKPAAITVTPMPASANDLLLEGQQLKHGVPADQRTALLAQVRTDAARYPGDRLADLVLARAELSLGDAAAGEAALKRRLEADPGDVEALLMQAGARMKTGDAAPERRSEFYREAGRILAPAVKAHADDFRVLFAYARSRSVEPGYPSDNMLGILRLALDLGPQVNSLRFTTADALSRRGKYDEAVIVLQPLVNDPHDGSAARAAREMQERALAARAATAPGAARDKTPPAGG